MRDNQRAFRVDDMSEYDVLILKVVTGKASVERAQFNQPVISLGRAGDCDFVIDGRGVSRRHAVIKLTSDGFQVQSLSRNPTTVNGESVLTTTLRHGDRIGLGADAALSVALKTGKRSGGDNGQEDSQAGGCGGAGSSERSLFRRPLVVGLAAAYAIGLIGLVAVLALRAPAAEPKLVPLATSENFAAMLFGGLREATRDAERGNAHAARGVAIYEQAASRGQSVAAAVPDLRLALAYWGVADDSTASIAKFLNLSVADGGQEADVRRVMHQIIEEIRPTLLDADESGTKLYNAGHWSKARQVYLAALRKLSLVPCPLRDAVAKRLALIDERLK